MNVEAVKALRDRIADSDQFDMDYWFSLEGADWDKAEDDNTYDLAISGKLTEIPCGTMACMWGHLTTLYPDRIRKFFIGYEWLGYHPWASQVESGAEILGIELRHANKIFFHLFWDTIPFPHDMDLTSDKRCALYILDRSIREGSFNWLDNKKERI